MSRDESGVLPRHGRPGVPLADVLNKGVSLVHRAAHDLAVFGEDGLDVRLGDHGCVEVADEDARVEGARVILVGHVAGLGLPGHPSPASGETHTHTHTHSGEGLNRRRNKQRAPLGGKTLGTAESVC